MARSSRRRPALIVVGVVLIVVGIVAGAVLWIASANRRSDTIAGFARAPVGCDTTLDFVESGEYFLYVESEGRLDEVRGDCAAEGSFDAGSSSPDAQISVVDPDGQTVELQPVGSSGPDYDDDGFVGAAAFRVDIGEAADHVVRVESEGDALFAVAVGGDPSDGVAALRIGGVVAAVVGAMLGLAAIVVGARRSTSPPAAPAWSAAPPWQQPGAPGAGPSVAPGGPRPIGPPIYGQPQGPPPYGGGAPAPTPPPPRTEAPPWSPPPQPRPAAAAPGAPRIPGERDLGSASNWSIEDDATTQERPDRAGRDDGPALPPPE